jgi:tRNA(fMet)-specific endonuclease VapC
MTHVLDFESCMALLRADSGLAERFMDRAAPEIAVPSVVRSELLLAARLSQRPIENTRLIESFLEPLVSLPFDEPCAEEYALLRADLPEVRHANGLENAAGQHIGPNTGLGATDLITAATAFANQLSILTVNPRAFAHLPRLKLAVLE